MAIDWCLGQFFSWLLGTIVNKCLDHLYSAARASWATWVGGYTRISGGGGDGGGQDREQTDQVEIGIEAGVEEGQVQARPGGVSEEGKEGDRGMGDDSIV